MRPPRLLAVVISALQTLGAWVYVMSSSLEAGWRALLRARRTISRAGSVGGAQSPDAIFQVEQPPRELQPESCVRIFQIDAERLRCAVEAVAQRIRMDSERLRRLPQVEPAASEREQRSRQLFAAFARAQRREEVAQKRLARGGIAHDHARHEHVLVVAHALAMAVGYERERFQVARPRAGPARMHASEDERGLRIADRRENPIDRLVLG